MTGIIGFRRTFRWYTSIVKIEILKIWPAERLSNRPLDNQAFQADIIVTDVPYGNLVTWQNENQGNVNLLDQLLPVTKEKTVVAICSDKSQKFQSEHFQRVEKQVIGKRLFQIFKLVQRG